MFFITCGGKPAQKNIEKDNSDTVAEKKSSANNNPNNKNNISIVDPSGEVLEIKGIDTSEFMIDTVLKLSGYKIIVAKNKYHVEHKKISKDDSWYNPLTMFVENETGDSVIYSKKFEENQFVTTYSFKDHTRNYITLSTSGGGSGFLSTIYKIETDKSFRLNTLASYNELCYYTFDKQGDELLLLQGIWAMFAEGSDDMGETHFADHVYDVVTIDLSTGKSTAHGTTRNKYPSEDSGTNPMELLKLIQKKEPKVCKNINMDAYSAE
jgi:hypothetical protein